MSTNARPEQMLIVDALEFSRPERPRFVEWREGGVGCVHVTLAGDDGAEDEFRAALASTALAEAPVRAVTPSLEDVFIARISGGESVHA